MRIAFVCHDPELYGASLSALDLAIALRYRNQQCIFILPNEGPLTSVLKQNGFEYHIVAYENWVVYKAFLYQNPYVSGNKLFRLFKLLRFAVKHIKLAVEAKSQVGKIDWVYSNSSLVIFGFFLARLTGAKHVLQFREFIGKGRDYIYVFSPAIRKFIYRRIPKFIFGTEALRNYYASETGNRGVRIYDPVDWETVKIEESGTNVANSLTFGMLGSINQNKGQFEMAEIFARLTLKYNQLRLLIAGEGETKTLSNFIAQNQLSNIIELRSYMRASLFYNSVDYVVINSKFEGFGRVAIEAMKSYKPVIGRNSTGTSELLGNNERGMLFDDEKSFEDIIDRIVTGKLDIKKVLQNAYKWAQWETAPIDVADRVLEYLEPGFKTNVFATIYRHRIWGETESVSGPGSTLTQTAKVRNMLPEICKSYLVKSLLDIPCGDLNWMQFVDLGDVQYTGADLVSNLIIANKNKFKSSGREFKVLDLLYDLLPDADLIFCRDCLVHFSFNDIHKALVNIKRSNIKYILVTTFIDRMENKDIQTGNWRPLNLQHQPFNFPEPKQLINEECTEDGGIYADKCLGLWELSEIKIQ